MFRTIIPDKTTAVTAAQAITAALFARERNGIGQHVRLAMLDTMVAYLWPEGMAGLTLVGKEVRAARAQLAPDLVFATTDGCGTTMWSAPPPKASWWSNRARPTRANLVRDCSQYPLV